MGMFGGAARGVDFRLPPPPCRTAYTPLRYHHPTFANFLCSLPSPTPHCALPSAAATACHLPPTPTAPLTYHAYTPMPIDGHHTTACRHTRTAVFCHIALRAVYACAHLPARRPPSFQLSWMFY